MTKVRYISLFSGIGGFELGIEHALGKENVECIGFSEVDTFALQVYQHHFPDHPCLGDVTHITEEQVKKLVKKHRGCDLLVGGFPCQNLSSLSRLNGTSHGLEGIKSKLFWNMINIIDWISKYNPKKTQLHIVIENNASMSNTNKQLITDILQQHMNIPVYRTPIDSSMLGVQRRKRIFWTTFILNKELLRQQEWSDILEPVSIYNPVSDVAINYCNQIIDNSIDNITVTCIKRKKGYTFIQKRGKQSRWQKYHVYSDTTNTYSGTITRNAQGIANYLLDRRVDASGKYFNIRYFTPTELERLFWYPDGWVANMCSKTRCSKLLGNTVVVKVIEYIIEHLKHDTRSEPTTLALH